MHRKVSITEDDDGAVIELRHLRIRYEFASWDEAIDALPNLPDIDPEKVKE